MDYISSIQKYFSDLNSSEHSYRTTFENYLREIFPTNEGYFTQQDQRAINGNKPDFVILKDKVPLLYIEVKKVGEDLDKIEKSNQADRYFGYDNLIISDYVEFRFFRNGQKYGEPISLASINKKAHLLEPAKDIVLLSQTVLDFVKSHKEPIKHGKHLAQIMGGKAQRIRDNVRDMLVSDSEKYTELLNIKKVVTENLVSSLEDDAFADMYAQTLVYGLFAARYNDKTSETFSRAEARDLVPKTNPFLHSFFDHIAGASFPDRLRFIVDELCEVFSHADVQKLLTEFYGKEKDNKDPVIHFYEDFLKEYDAKKKMEMGVFYTPRPVVQFIVRTIDEILKKEFGLPKGLADTEKIKVKKQERYQAQSLTKAEQSKDGKIIDVEKEYHKVQVLDIATGTGTFLNEVIEHVHKSFVGQEGRWEAYVKENLLPRLHGFELMMASYTIAHLKLGMTLADTGIKNLDQRLGVYLTNTLEEPKDYSNQGSLFGFMDAIAQESKSASRIKSEYPIMCVIGNPPYSGESMNKDYTGNAVYKIEIGGKQKLQERNSKWINDDYVKFIRFAENLVEKNGEGIVGMITAHGYIDNPTFRGMRWHLRKTFDKIYVVDLHGNSNKKETSLDGSKDENVFDIKTGVSIIFGIKKSNTKERELATVYKLDLYGIRKDKFEVLEKGTLENIPWQELPQNTDLWVLEGKGKSEYIKGFSVAEIFPVNSVGVVTAKDAILINDDKKELLKNVTEFYKIEPEESFIQKISYRPFDNKYIYYQPRILERPRESVSSHMLKENISFNLNKTIRNNLNFYHCFVSKNLSDLHLFETANASLYFSPLYLYTDQNEKIPNINKEIWSKINETVGETTPENILDYIYATLHSPSYREKYKEFLKIDFPRVPYPENKEKFFALAKIGEQLRNLHLMTSKEANEIITTFPEAGTDEVEKLSYKDTAVCINDIQYFGNVPEIAWNFYIGGYQPAQKYLKDRKGRKLSNDEIEHYQKIIKVLVETDRLMSLIDTYF